MDASERVRARLQELETIHELVSRACDKNAASAMKMNAAFDKINALADKYKARYDAAYALLVDAPPVQNCNTIGYVAWLERRDAFLSGRTG